MLSELDVINACLGIIGESPVTNAQSNHPSALAVRTVLDRVSKRIQRKGWWFNREYRFTLNPDTNDEVPIPANTLKCDPVRDSVNYVQRGTRMYDPVNHTYTIGESIEVDIILELDLEDCPYSIAEYIMKQTMYEFYRNDDGDSDKTADLKQEAMLAKVEAMQEHLAAADINSQNRPISRLMMQRIKGPLGVYSNGTNPDIPGG